MQIPKSESKKFLILCTFKLILHGISFFIQLFLFRMPVWPAAEERRNGYARLLEDDYCSVTDEIVKVFNL
jgi:hypothetical protein